MKTTKMIRKMELLSYIERLREFSSFSLEKRFMSDLKVIL